MEPAGRQSTMRQRTRGMSVMTTNTMFGPALGPNEMPPRMPAPSHRHATPSGPWPFLDVDDPVDKTQLDTPPTEKGQTEICTHIDPVKCNNCWKGYPQSLYANWTEGQQKKSRIAHIVQHPNNQCTIHYSDIRRNGTFNPPRTLPVTAQRNAAHWKFMIQPRPNTTRLRAMFLEELSGPVLQMIGTKYNVEPFFWSSSLSWIPSRYQESVVPGEGDHITVTLRFIRSMENPTADLSRPQTPTSPAVQFGVDMAEPPEADSDDEGEKDEPANQIIDTQAPLVLRSDHSNMILLPDLIALHLVRVRPVQSDESRDENQTSSSSAPSTPISPASSSAGGSSTIISFHPQGKHKTTPASTLHKRLALVGRSVYWEHIFGEFPDPTFVLLALMWYPLYAWDEAFEYLYKHVGYLEMNVIKDNPLYITHELHIVHAHILHYSALLEDFKKSIAFIRDTPNPALDHVDYDGVRDRCHERLERECNSLLREIKRLEDTRSMMARRLKNVMHLGFSRTNIEDSKYMQTLAEATVADSAAMKQVAYLTMIFLPASFVATVFGMNVEEINPGSLQSLRHYAIATVLLTLFTVWTIIAFQYPIRGTKARSEIRDPHPPAQPPTSQSAAAPLNPWQTAIRRALWPITMIADWRKLGRNPFDSDKDSVKATHSPLRTRNPRRWRPYSFRQWRPFARFKKNNTSPRTSSVSSNTGGKMRGVSWTLGLPRLEREQESPQPQNAFVQSPVPLSAIAEESRV